MQFYPDNLNVGAKSFAKMLIEASHWHKLYLCVTFEFFFIIFYIFNSKVQFENKIFQEIIDKFNLLRLAWFPENVFESNGLRSNLTPLPFGEVFNLFLLVLLVVWGISVLFYNEYFKFFLSEFVSNINF